MFTGYQNSTVKLNIETIEASLKACIDNKATFPEHIKVIFDAGVVKYQVDLTQGLVIYYGKEQHSYQTKLPKKYDSKSLFAAKEIEEGIAAVRKGTIGYTGFLEKISLAGVTQYCVDIPAMKTTYSGKSGENHVEPFLNPKSTTANNP